MNDRKPEAIPSASWVTFCMTTYKRPDFLREQLNNILKQTFGDFSIIISDNDVEGSAKRIVEEIDDPRIFYYVNESNLGMVKSFNRSLFKAMSEYVVMITDDDPVYPEMLTVLYDLTKKYPGYGAYFGGCDIRCINPEVARSSRLRVGTNSCLANLPIGTVRTYTGKEFTDAYFNGSLGCHILWSTGIVKRELAFKIGGMPDFDAPYNTDFGYIVLSGAQNGLVLLNTSLGCQVVHGANYGYTEADFEKFYITPSGFQSWIFERLPDECKSSNLKRNVETFLGRWVVEYAVSVKRYAKDKKIPTSGLDFWINKIFQISYLRKWRYKYYIALNFPRLLKLLIIIKNSLRKDAQI
jgi:glycosyltransferase involved in cell wall biosynthesis